MSNLLEFDYKWAYGLIPLVTIPYLLLSVGEGWDFPKDFHAVNDKNLLTGKDNVRNNEGWVVFWHLIVTLFIFGVILLALVYFDKSKELTFGNWLGGSGMFMNAGVGLGFVLHILSWLLLYYKEKEE